MYEHAAVGILLDNSRSWANGAPLARKNVKFDHNLALSLCADAGSCVFRSEILSEEGLFGRVLSWLLKTLTKQ